MSDANTNLGTKDGANPTAPFQVIPPLRAERQV
jgi:hypothetical protein